MRDWHYSDLKNRMYCTTEDGKKISMPRYYKDKLYHESQRKAIGVHARAETLKRDMRRLELGNVLTERELVEAHKAAFARHHLLAENGRDSF